MRHSSRSQSIIMTNSVPLVYHETTVISRFPRFNRIRLCQDAPGLPADSWPFVGSSRLNERLLPRMYHRFASLILKYDRHARVSFRSQWFHQVNASHKSYRECQGRSSFDGKTRLLRRSNIFCKDRTARILSWGRLLLLFKLALRRTIWPNARN